MIYILCFRICSNWKQFHTELIFPKGMFQKNGYPENFFDKCFKRFLKNIHLAKENVPTVKKKAYAPTPSIIRNNVFENKN